MKIYHRAINYAMATMAHLLRVAGIAVEGCGPEDSRNIGLARCLSACVRASVAAWLRACVPACACVCVCTLVCGVVRARASDGSSIKKEMKIQTNYEVNTWYFVLVLIYMK